MGDSERNEQEVDQENIPDIGEFGRVEKLLISARKERDEISKEVKKKYPGVRLFSLITPYSGVFIVRAQDVADIKASTKAVDTFIEEEIQKEGGREKLAAMTEIEKAPTIQRINAEASDISNDVALSRCVVYPYDFAERIKTGVGIPAGTYPLLIEKIYEVSGWQDVEVEEI